MSKHGRVLVAMSGGIDSSVAALMLHQQGYEVLGITMKTWDYATSGGIKKTTGCCSLDDINDARHLAVTLGFPHYVIDIRDEFGDYIINNFVNEYMAGRTPNPCVLCNTHIKWESLIKKANQLDCEFIATGHYAQIRQENNRFIISKGIDEQKDQSYVLWGITQENLARTKFPLGAFQKTEIRKFAAQNGFEEIAKKHESYEICFIPDNDYRGFLKRKVQNLEKLEGGNFIDTKGKILGQHKGYPFYTIGQRKGLEIALGEPMFVVKIDAATNTVVLGKENDLQKHSIWVKQPNFIKYSDLDQGKEVLTKIRYKDKGSLSFAQSIDGKIKIDFFSPAKAVAPGQSAVLYEGNDLVAGGFIEK